MIHLHLPKPPSVNGISAPGKRLSERETLGFSSPQHDYGWISRFWVPFTYAASKNHIYGFGHHVHKRAASRQIQDAIYHAAKSALRGRTVYHNKVWIGIYVEKPDNRGDAINVVDLVCDALKLALEIDDRWFCISFVDWSINKNEPMLMIQVAQEDEWHAQACSSCGKILPLDQFHKHSGNKHGVARNCMSCNALSRELRKARRKEQRGA